MNPYYNQDGITIWHGDCREIIPSLPKVDLVLTDPPYPKLKGGLKHCCPGVSKRTIPTVTIGTPWGNEIEAIKMFQNLSAAAVVFCSWHSIGEVKSLCGGEAVGLVTWHKRNSQMSFRNRPHYTCEYAWMIEYAPGPKWMNVETFYDIPGLVAGCMATERILEDDTGKAAHPTQKPIQLMYKLLAVSDGTILDPFMGSGTTLRAAKDLGRKAIGIEIEEKYCEIAARRLEQGVLQL